MNKIMVLAAATLLTATSANANVVLSDTFDGESAGSVLNFTGFDNFDVEDGTVDYLKGFSGLNCVSGGCVDLDGSTRNGGTLVTKLGYAFGVGDIVRFSFAVSGNQRNGSADNVFFGFRSTGGAISYNSATISVNGLPVTSSNYFGLNYDTALLGTTSSMPFTTYGVSFTAGNAGAIKAYVGTNSADDVGPILDNFTVEVTPSVPEPATWSLMIGGFALVGAAMRRRVRAVRYA